MNKQTTLACVGILVCGGLLGCDSGKKERSSVDYYAKGAQKVITRLRAALPTRNGYSVLDGVRKVNDNLAGLSDLLEKGKDRIDRWEERKKHAEEAHKYFVDNIKYKILVDDAPINIRLHNYDVNELNGLLDELAKLVDKVDKL